MRNYFQSVIQRSIITTLIFMLFSTYAQASEYIIKFYEGAYEFDPSKKFDSLDNKYLSRVTISKDGVTLIEVKGSTLPDSSTFYELWHDSEKIESPSDKNVLDLYEDARHKQCNIETLKEAALLPDEFLSFMYEYVTLVPVLYSGLYKFSIGLHKNGASVHGQPYVPRLMGSKINSPFSGKDGYLDEEWTTTVEDGGFIKTITYNKILGEFKANGINIHDGRWSGSHRDSAGCLTIDPRNWTTFYEALPNIQTWKSDNHEGYVVIIRKGEEDLECKIPNHNCSDNTPPSIRGVQSFEIN